MRLTPRRPIGVLGLWHDGPGASRAASRDWWRPVSAGVGLARTRDPAAVPAASSPWQSRHCSTPRASGLSGEPDHADRALGLEQHDCHPTQPPLHQPLVMISLRCSGRGGESHGVEVRGIRFGVLVGDHPKPRGVIPAKAGIHLSAGAEGAWVPAFAGMTAGGCGNQCASINCQKTIRDRFRGPQRARPLPLLLHPLPHTERRRETPLADPARS